MRSTSRTEVSQLKRMHRSVVHVVTGVRSACAQIVRRYISVAPRHVHSRYDPPVIHGKAGDASYTFHIYLPPPTVQRYCCNYSAPPKDARPQPIVPFSEFCGMYFSKRISHTLQGTVLYYLTAKLIERSDVSLTYSVKPFRLLGRRGAVIHTDSSEADRDRA